VLGRRNLVTFPPDIVRERLIFSLCSTGRKRRCGWFDAVVVRYAHQLNSFTSLNLTKLDVLDDVEEIRIGVAYKIRGETLPPAAMPSTLEDLAAVEVVYESEWCRVAAAVASCFCTCVGFVCIIQCVLMPPHTSAVAAMPGWKTSTRGVRKFTELPKAARAYVKRLEELTGVPIAWVGTGAGRHDMVTRGFTMPAATQAMQ
jgi:adenylosuccinate synthase